VAEGIEEEDYGIFLRWYGDRVHKELWSKMWMVGTREMAKMDEHSDGSSVCSPDMEEVDRNGEDHTIWIDDINEDMNDRES